MTPADVLASVATDRGVTVDALRGRERTRYVVAARRAAVVALLGLGMSCREIGQLLDRDHTSVIYLRDTAPRCHPVSRTAGQNA